jgi:trehalose 6-phosphate synthase/phosphatase
MRRLLIVSNRLPITVRRVRDRIDVIRSPGGLATGLRGPHERSGGLWIGWSGAPEDLDDHRAQRLARRLEEQRLVPVSLTASEAERYYEGFSNEVLWPLFHYRLDQLPLHIEDWDAYVAVNKKFADAVAAHHAPGDLVWVHDYQLMLVPQMLRERIPDARIGFFLHIPFPSSEVFRTLPSREAVVDGLLGADLIGFHTPAYVRHFASTVLRVRGVEVDVDRVHVGARAVRLGVFPMGIDTAAFVALAQDPSVVAEAERFRSPDGAALFVGIDRLDYTKGLPRRLLAFEHLLDAEPALRERIRLIQVAVPSRTGVRAYRKLRAQVEAMVGRVNGRYATPHWTPVHYIYRSLSQSDLVALYRAADVMLVTPVRDGMNLVAKEFVASRVDGGGVLVVSEFAGAAAELGEALRLNPYDVAGSAAVYRRALALPEAERRSRMEALRKRVLRFDVHAWAETFIEALEASSALRGPTPTEEAARIEHAARAMRSAEHLLLFLDYDGTLVPFADLPELAAPDAEILGLLRVLAMRPRTAVHVVSGRSHSVLDAWLGSLPIALHAEHGLWSRTADGWRQRALPSPRWRERVLRILEHFTVRTPGALIEEKTASIAWHYRMAEPDFGSFQAHELRVHLTELLSNLPVEVLSGEKVIEVRPAGVNKGMIVADAMAAMPPGTLVAAMGDDRTDEDLFAALPSGGIAIHVGLRPSAIPLQLQSVADVRRLLRSLVETSPPASLPGDGEATGP